MWAGFRLDNWEIDPKRGVAKSGGRSVRLEPKGTELLVYLAGRPSEVISREELLDAIWPGVTVGEEVITSAIAKIRRALGDDPKDPRFLVAIRRYGMKRDGTAFP